MNLHEALMVMESKKIGASLIDRSREEALLRVERHLPHSVRLREIRTALTASANAYIAWVLARVAEGEVDLKAAKAAMITRFMAALMLGHEATGVKGLEPSDNELLSIASLVETELEYLAKFVAGDEAMNKSQRAALYGIGVQDAFYRGWIATLPANVLIAWKLSIAEHCIDCLFYAQNSPYGKPDARIKPLPTLPGNGDSQCLGNCRCFLVAEGQSGYKAKLKPTAGIEVTKIGNRTIDPMSPAGLAAGSLYQIPEEEVIFYRRLFDLDGRDEWDKLRRQAQATIDLIARQQVHEIRPTMTLAEQLEPLSRARANNLKFVAPDKVDDDLLGLIVFMLAADEARRGKVTAVNPDPPSVTLDDGETYRLDRSGRWILFTEAS